MIKAPLPANESLRQNDLKQYMILDSVDEEQFDRITELASIICETPISVISLVDKDRQWFKSRHGNIPVTETSRDIAFCSHAILDPNNILVVNDVQKDERFRDNPLTTGDPHINFYAGAPLISEAGFPLGTLCVIDHKPRELSEYKLKALKMLADWVVVQMELKRKNYELERMQIELQSTVRELKHFGQVISHDLRSPLRGIMILAKELENDYGPLLDDEGKRITSFIYNRSAFMNKMALQLLEYASTPRLLQESRENFPVKSLFDETAMMLDIPEHFRLEYNVNGQEMIAPKMAVQQILLNLCTNAIKYNDKDNGVLKLDFKESETHYQFSVEDNGPGIPASFQVKMYELFQTLNITDRNSEKGTGIGLTTVKKLVETLGGSIDLHSEVDKGCRFVFTISK